MITVISSPRSHHQLSHQSAIMQGFAALGIDSKRAYPFEKIKTKAVACWGWRIGRSLRNKGHEVIVMERGYLGDRFQYTSLGWNGLNGHAEFPEYEPDNGKRFKALGIKLKPWRKSGEYALIMGQVPGDQSLKGQDMIPWYEEKAKEILELYNIPVYFRPHPDLEAKGIHQTVNGTIPSQGSLQDALSGAAFTVCYNSNSSVDSVINGIPCFIGDEGSMAYQVCSKSIDELIKPDRKDWAYKIAQKQWSMDEIRSGEALEGFKCRLGSL